MQDLNLTKANGRTHVQKNGDTLCRLKRRLDVVGEPIPGHESEANCAKCSNAYGILAWARSV